MKFSTILFLLVFLGGCEQYEISYVEQVPILEQEIKLPDIGPPGSLDRITENNVAFHFILENIEISDLNFNEFLTLNLFVCGQRGFENSLQSALYFPKELKFLFDSNDRIKDRSIYAVFIPDLLENMEESAKKHGNSLCARVVYRYPYELKKVSNTVTLNGTK